MGKKIEIRMPSLLPATFQLYLKGAKHKLLMLCLTQAIVCSVVIVYILVYLPHMVLDEEITDNLGSNHEMERKKTENKLARLSSRIEFESYYYTLFRYDQLYLDEESESKPNDDMINAYGEYSYFAKNAADVTDKSPGWFLAQTDYCNGCFVVYGKRIIHLKNVTINPSFGHGKAGGEDVYDVMNQDESSEVYTMRKGYFTMDADTVFLCNESLSHDLHTFVSSLIVKKSSSSKLKRAKTIDKYSILTIRYEFANFYHTTMNWYDMFLIMVLFKIDPRHLNSVWMDGHPRSKLDDSWEVLFGKQTRAGSINSPVTYTNMIWNGFASRSQINQHKLDGLPFVEEYRHFVLSRFDIPDDHVLDCSKIRITIIWRRDHVAHPRNPAGFIPRKIANEEEVWNAVKQADYTAIVNGAQLDELNMADQLDLMTKTDILIGVHGAGLSHILYLPKSAGVIEIFPQYTSVSNAHFRAMAKWRRLSYIAWINQNMALEKDNHRTHIPPSLISDMVKTMKYSLCREKNEL